MRSDNHKVIITVSLIFGAALTVFGLAWIALVSFVGNLMFSELFADVPDKRPAGTEGFLMWFFPAAPGIVVAGVGLAAILIALRFRNKR